MPVGFDCQLAHVPGRQDFSHSFQLGGPFAAVRPTPTDRFNLRKVSTFLCREDCPKTAGPDLPRHS